MRSYFWAAAKAYLVANAKREAVAGLFGEAIRSVSQVENFVLVRDKIETISSGFVRVEGSPAFFNGTGLGEVCVKIQAYVLQEDLDRFRPRQVQKKVCIADPRLSLGVIRETAEQQARIQAVRDFEPKLEKIRDDAVLGLLHESRTENGGFIPETTTYCVTARGLVYPIEMMTLTDERTLQKFNLEDVLIECWGQDVNDGSIGPWKHSFPHCVLNDGGGDDNAVFDGSVSLEGDRICLKLANLASPVEPSHTLAIGFVLKLRHGRFDDGSTTKVVEMRRFTGQPDPKNETKCFTLP